MIVSKKTYDSMLMAVSESRYEVESLKKRVESLELIVKTLVGEPSKEGGETTVQHEAKRVVDFSIHEGFYPNEDYGGR